MAVKQNKWSGFSSGDSVHIVLINNCFTIRINLFCKLKGIGCSKISICWSYSQYKASFFCNELENHVLYLSFNIDRLVTDWDFCQARQVNESDVQDWKTTKFNSYPSYKCNKTVQQ